MKTCVKVLIWVGMIIQFYMIYPIVFGILALKKLDSFKDRDELIKYSVLTMVFCSLAGGIVMLFMNEEKKPSTNNDNTNKEVVEGEATIQNTLTMEEELLNAKRLFEEGTISEADYNEIKSKIINKYYK